MMTLGTFFRSVQRLCRCLIPGIQDRCQFVIAWVLQDLSPVNPEAGSYGFQGSQAGKEIR